jgi:hypothetical protein
MAFLGISVPLEVGRLLAGLDVPGEKESPSEYHITILCFEENWPISEISKALEATYEVMTHFNGSLNCFAIMAMSRLRGRKMVASW